MAPKVSTLAVETNIFPLYEITDGLHYRLNYMSKALPVEQYLSVQGRYANLTPEQIQSIQAETDRAWQALKRRSGGQS
jgi:pyruvate ferredoxin oxidoreductase beta subunit/2-oxoisovalerate ferredoxin oxidoreductase beta subunit